MEFQETTPQAKQALESESRRRFVAQTGMVTAAMALGGTGLAAAAAMPPLTTAVPPKGGTGRPLRVGLLLPDARAYPLLGTQLLAGAQAFAAQSGNGAPLQFTPVVYGSRPQQAEGVVRQMLGAGQVDVLAGFVCANTAAQWAPLLAEHQVPLLVGDAGANALAPQARSEWVVRNSLGHWQAAWAAGRWAAKALGPRAIVAVGPADSGFDHLPAFERGFASAGGRVQATVFTRAADGTSQLDALAQLVRQTRPDLVFALDSGVRAEAFQQFWSRSDAARHVPLVAGGMLGETMAAASQAHPPARGTRIWASRPWQQGASDAGLVATLGTGNPTPFHLLGHEMAQRMHAAVGLSDARGLLLAKAMESTVLQTLRGEVHLDAGTGETMAPAYLQGLHLDPASSIVALAPVRAGSCQGLCDILGSRIAGTYLAA